MPFTNKVIIIFFSAILFLMAALSAVMQQPYWLMVPSVLLLLLYLLKHPLYLFYLLILTIPWSLEVSFNNSLATDLPDEPLMLLTAFCSLLMLAFYFPILKKQQLHPLILILILQFSWTLITVATSTTPIFSVKYILAKSWYLLAFVAAPLLLPAKEKINIIKHAAVILCCSMFAATTYALVRHSFYGFSFEKVNNALQPFFRNHVNYSALLVCMIPIEYAMIRLFRPKPLRYIAAFALLITLIALYFSYARGAWLALLTGLLSLWLIRKRLLLIVFALFFVTCISFVFYLKAHDRYLGYSTNFKTTIFHTDFSEHLIATYHWKDVSTAERFYRWVAAVRMTSESWITGFGPTSFYNNYRSYALPAFKTWVSKNQEHSTVHNYFLLMFVEQGLFGLLIFLLLLGTMLWYVQNIYHKSKELSDKIMASSIGAILYMVSAIIFLSDLIETDKTGSIFYLCLAAIIILDRKTNKSDPSLYIKRIS